MDRRHKEAKRSALSGGAPAALKEMEKDLNEGRLDSPSLRFGEYEIRSRLGDGEQGWVFEGKNRNGKSYAIKFSNPEWIFRN